MHDLGGTMPETIATHSGFAIRFQESPNRALFPQGGYYFVTEKDSQTKLSPSKRTALECLSWLWDNGKVST